MGWLVFGFLFALSTARADMAVLIQITDQNVSLTRVERVIEVGADVPMVVEDTQQLLPGSPTSKPALPEDEDKLLVRWYNANGELIHHEVLRDPRFIHAPGSQEMRLPEATQLLRAPNDAVLLRVRPRAFGQFIDFNV